MTPSPIPRQNPRIWRLGSAEPGAAARLQEILRISGLLSGVLARRGFGDPERAQAFLSRHYDPGDPGDLPGMAEAVKLLRRARRNGSTVAVYGDYDVDGVVGTVVLREALRRLGFGGDDGQVRFHIPRRQDGYGLNEAAVKDLADEGVKLLVTVDCGTSATGEVDLARRLGMEVIITDHHRAPTDPDSSGRSPSGLGPELPAASAIINPWLSAKAAPERVLCGAGIALKLAQALLGGVDEQWLDLAAVATVADVVPLAGENRGLVSRQLPRLPGTHNPGLRALIEVAGLAGKELTTRDLAFALGPRINALGRVDRGDAAGAVTALSTDSPDLAMTIARRMDRANRQRQEAEEKVLAAARAQAARVAGELPPALVAAGSGWGPGVIGIVAARLARDYGRPAAVISLSDGICRGSARSVAGVDLRSALAGCSGLLGRFGGHAGAAGFEVGAGNVEAFRERFAAVVAEMGLPDQEIVLDGLLPLPDLDESVVRDLESLSPHGEGNPEPLLCVPGVTVEDARRVGDGTHLKMLVRHGRRRCEAIAFGLADAICDVCGPNGVVDLACTPVINEFRGVRSVQLQVRAARTAAPASSLPGR